MNSIQFWINDNILKGKKENILKFMHSPYNARTHTQKVPAKLQIGDDLLLSPRSANDEENRSVSEYYN